MEEHVLMALNWVKNPQNWKGLLDFIAGFCGVTSVNGRALLATGLVVAGVMVFCLVIKAVIKYWDTLLEAGAILFAAYHLHDLLRKWFIVIAEALGVTSTEGRFWLAVVLGGIGLIVGVAVIKWVIKKTFGSKMPDEKKLEGSLRELHDYIFLRGNIPAHINIREGYNTLIFEWLSHWLTEKSYEAKIRGSIEGRIRMSGAEVKYERSTLKHQGFRSDNILVNVFIPAGYFMVNFDSSDVDDISYSGWFANHYTPAEIRRYFDEQCPSLVRQFIEDNDMLAKTKDIARNYIVSTMLAQIEKLVDPATFKSYEVEVSFQSQTWDVFRGTDGESPKFLTTIYDN